MQQKFRFEITEILRTIGTVHSGCTDPTQATVHLVNVLLSRIQNSGNGDNNFDKWKGTFGQTERDKWTAFKAVPEYSSRTKLEWPVPFGVPTEISGILGWMESAFWLTRNDYYNVAVNGLKHTNDISILHSQYHHGLTDRRPITWWLNWQIRLITKV